MSEDLLIKMLICFILGWFASKMMGNGFSVGGNLKDMEQALIEPGLEELEELEEMEICGPGATYPFQGRSNDSCDDNWRKCMALVLGPLSMHCYDPYTSYTYCRDEYKNSGGIYQDWCKSKTGMKIIDMYDKDFWQNKAKEI